VIEKERQRDGSRVQSDRSHPIFSRSRSRRIESSFDILRRLVDVARTSSDLLIRRYWQPSFDEARRGGWLGSSTIQGTMCARVHVCNVCARVPVSITSHLFPSIRLSVGRLIGRFALSLHSRECERERKKEREHEGERCAGGLGFVCYQIPR